MKNKVSELNEHFFLPISQLIRSILDILVTAENLPYECASICSFCSRMKRGRIYSTARQHGYNVLALGQHLDDVCERYLAMIYTRL